MNLTKIKKVLGPGLLFASAAIGVSHLVQSTRAGANYGYELLGIILLVNILKFPFFEYGARYANASKESLIDGYNRLGKWALWTYFLITIGSMFFVTAAVGFVTAGFMDNLFGLSAIWPSFKLFPVALTFIISVGLLLFGKFNLLDDLMKVIGIILLTSTIVAFVITLIQGSAPKIEGFIPPNAFDEAGILFIIALMGWMPTALDLSSWTSLWMIEKIKATNYKPTLKETLSEFNFGYWISAALSICFVTLGAYLVYGTGKTMPEGSVGFADMIIKLYTTTIGNWSYVIIAASAFSIMLGTCFTVFDGYARTLERTSELLFMSKENSKEALNNNRVYNISLLVLSAISFIIIAFFINHFKKLIDLATTISFLIAPLVAVANFKLVSKKYIGNATPNNFMRFLSYVGVIFLTGFAVFYLYIKL